MDIDSSSLDKEPSKSWFGRIGQGAAAYLRNIRLFSPNARRYLVGSFLMALNFQVFLLLFNLYLKESGYMEGQIGQIASARAVGMTVIAIPAAILLSRIRLKYILLTACVLFALFSYFLISVNHFAAIVAFSLLAGMSFAFYRVAAGPFFMRNSSSAERTHLFSVSFAMMTLAGMVGSLTAGKAAALVGAMTGDLILGYRYALFGGVGVGLLAIAPFLMLKTKAPSREEDRISVSFAQFRKRGRLYFRITLANLLIGSGAGLIIPFLPLYFRDRFGLPADTIGLLYFGVMVSMFVGTLSGPVLAKKFGLVRTIVVTQLISIPFMLVLAYSFFLPLVIVAFTMRGGLMNLGVPILNNLGMELSEKREQGLVNALLMVAWTGSWMVSAALGGHLIERYGYTVTLNISVILYVASSAFFYLFFRDVERRDPVSGGWAVVREGIA
jgi:predicted MFS family arabinose efflux permease